MADAEPLDAKHERHRRRLANLIDRLPNRLRSVTHWLLRPESRWARVPAGALLILGGFLSILPVSDYGCSRSDSSCSPKICRSCGAA